MTTVEIHDLASDFLAAASGWLERDPVLCTVIATNAQRLARHEESGRPRQDHPSWWAVSRDEDGEVTGVAMGTAPFVPYPPYLLPMPDDAARQLAQALRDRGVVVTAANGAMPTTQVFADEVAGFTGATVEIYERTRLFHLPALVDPAVPSGRLRVAGRDDTELCLAWFRDFIVAVDEVAGRVVEPGGGEHFERSDIEDRIDAGAIWLWEDAGEIVHLTAANQPAFGVVRIGPVYTPAEHRGRGYASAAVAAVSREALGVGHRACLFTDQANPTSNHVYEALGYRPVVDMVNLRINAG